MFVLTKAPEDTLPVIPVGKGFIALLFHLTTYWGTFVLALLGEICVQAAKETKEGVGEGNNTKKRE